MNTFTSGITKNEKEVLFHPELLQKFDINGPRYTSYPSADRFHNQFTEVDYLGALKRVAMIGEPLSLYFHLPFCPNICYYCGCNKIITKDHGRSAKYIKYLAKEMQMVFKAMGATKKLPITQLHWGGGTPTFLSHEEMIELMAHTREHFDLLPGVSIRLRLTLDGLWRRILPCWPSLALIGLVWECKILTWRFKKQCIVFKRLKKQMQ